MPATSPNPHKYVLATARLLQRANRELTALNETLMPGSTSVARSVTRAKRAERTHQPKPAAKVEIKEDPRHLSEIEQHDLKTLLQKTSIPVAVIAQMLDVSRAAVYQWRDKFGLDVRRSPHRKNDKTTENGSDDVSLDGGAASPA